MSGVWSKVRVLDIVLPSNGALVPGSNTMYIGGPRLPADLVADGVTGALIWYSNEDGLALGIDYWYLAHFNLPPDATDLLQVGYKLTGAGRKAIWGGFITNTGVEAATFESVDQTILKTELGNLYIDSGNHMYGTSDLTMDFDIGDIIFMDAGDQMQLRALKEVFVYANFVGSTVVIGWESNGESWVFSDANTSWTTCSDPLIDTWLSATSTQTVLGVANTVCTAVWRICYDRTQEAYITWIFPGVPAALSGNLPLPGAYTAGGPDDRADFRTPSLPAGGLLKFGHLAGDNGAFGVGTNLILRHRVATPFTNVTLAESAANALNIDRIFMQYTYQVDKP